MTFGLREDNRRQFGKVHSLITPLPPLPRSIGIINFGEIRELIYGLQSLRGKILSRKELQSEIGSWMVHASIAERNLSVKVV